MVTSDPIDLLLPESSERRRRTARALVTCLRLVLDSGRSTPAGVVGLSMERARAELDQQSRRRLLRALLDLVRHGLEADLSPASFASSGTPEFTRQAAWSLIEEYRDELEWLPEVPAPNERSSETVARLLDAASRLGLPEPEERLWRVRALRAREGQEAGERAWRELVLECDGAAFELGARVEALAGLWECWLDRGAVRLVRQDAEERRELVRGSERLARLAGWARLCSGEEPAAPPDGPAWRGILPAALAELREARPEWLPHLCGRAPTVERAGERGRGDGGLAWLRRAAGASAVGVFALRLRGACELVEFDVAPALRARVREWARELEFACREPGTPEHRTVTRAAPCAAHRGSSTGADGSTLRAALAPASTRAAALAPILDSAGEVLGWLRLEFEHHLVPTRAELAAAAEPWRQRLEGPLPGELAAGAACALEPGAFPEGREGPVADALRALVVELGMKTAQRRWWGFELDGERLVPVCEGGAALAGRGGARGLVRAQRSSAPVRFDAPDRELSVSADAASGLVLPIRAAGVPCGFIAIESLRRNDFPESTVQRCVERAARGTELAIARFREWHRARHGFDVWFSESSGDGAGWVEQLFAAARASGPCALSGPPGSGRRVVSRWLQFEGGRGAAPLVTMSATDAERDGWAERGPSAELLDRARAGVVVIFDVERLGEAGQLRLLELWERPASERRGPRWIAVSQRTPTELRESGALRADLCRRLERLHVRVPPLSERRPELPRIAVALARRWAAEEGVAPPLLEDSALALLWRQPWGGNVRELENLMFKLVLMHAGRSIGAEELERTARRAGIELLRRVPSRQPDPELLRAALLSTANLRGSINKTRAALYLGWDPDTLVSRMGELGLNDAPSSVAMELERDRSGGSGSRAPAAQDSGTPREGR